MQEHNND